MILHRRETGIEHLIDLLERTLPERGARLVRLSDDRPVVFVGDIHGDRDAVDRVLSQYPRPENVLVFLGDIVDRGPDSLGCLTCIVEAMHDAPTSVHLLMGNHEARAVTPFSPANFWEGLSPPSSQVLARLLMNLPWAAYHPTGVAGSHGALPELPTLADIDTIEAGSTPWRAITWGDWVNDERRATRIGSRPAFGPIAFAQRTEALGIRIHVRSHQPSAPPYLFEDRCLTLFTSSAYGKGPRQIAMLPAGQPVVTAHDLQCKVV